MKEKIVSNYFRPICGGNMLSVDHPDPTFASTDYTDKYYIHHETGRLFYPSCEFDIYQKSMKSTNIEDPNWILITGSFQWEVYGFDNVIILNRFIKSLHIIEENYERYL